MQALIGKKVEQTQRFLTDGTRIPVTVIAVSANTVVQVKTLEKDGYSAVQMGFGSRKKATKPLEGHLKAAKLTTSPKILREVRLNADEAEMPTVGALINASDVLKSGDVIKVTGTGKGKGFQGGVRRHGFKGGPRTHGQSDRERAPGSIGQTTTPGRVYKGKRMAGHMGAHTVSVPNLVVVDVDGENVLVKGLVPGVLNATVFIEKTGELKNPVELYSDKPAVDPTAAEVLEESPTQEVTAEAVVEQVAEAKEEVKESETTNNEVGLTAEEAKTESVAVEAVKTEEVAPSEETKEEVKEEKEAKS